MKAPDAIARRYVLYFKESLRGLAVGAPVTLLGLPAGEVTSIGLEFDAAKANVRSRVVITFFPSASWRTRMQRRMRAVLPPHRPMSRSAATSCGALSRSGASLRRLVEERGCVAAQERQPPDRAALRMPSTTTRTRPR